MNDLSLRWFRVCRVSDLKPGQARSVTVLAKPYAVFNIGGTLHGLEASCRHMKANLAAGTLDGEIVQCAMHGWEYNVTSGECLTVDESPLQKCPVKIERDEIWIGIPLEITQHEVSQESSPEAD